MTVHSDRIKPDDCSIRTYLDNLRRKEYQIPTFQREVVWDEDSVKKLWDSIFRFYPIGSILVWNTDLQLQNHRSIGGHVIADDNGRDRFQYILDGQQRTTSLLTSLHGGTIEGRGDFDPILYFDLTIEDEDEIDDTSYKERFLFWNEIDDRDGSYTRNSRRMARHREGLIVKLQDVLINFEAVEERLAEGAYPKFGHPIRRRLRVIRDVLDKYRLSIIRLKGIEVSEVCQIFERINQEGQPLDIFDIVVAKTFRLETDTQPGFYLRELVENFRDETPGKFADLGDLTYLQAIAIVLYQHMSGTGIYNITPTYLNRIRTEHIEAVWPGVTVALRKTFDFLENYLHLKGPRLVPFRYFYLSLVSHFYENRNPNYDLLKRYFWYYSFHNEELLRNTTHLRRHVRFLDRARTPGRAELDRFLIDREQLRTASYSTRGRLSTAILCLLANQEPRDWATPDRRVLSDVYYVLTSKPNLHHIFPTGFLEKHPGDNELDSDSLMNIAYLTQITNLEISAKDPVKYLRKYDGPEFEDVLETHLVPLEILEWARQDEMPEDALDQFIEWRIDLMIQELRSKLPGVAFDVIDTKEGSPDSE